jgi:hypothetical protein
MPARPVAESSLTVDLTNRLVAEVPSSDPFRGPLVGRQTRDSPLQAVTVRDWHLPFPLK